MNPENINQNDAISYSSESSEILNETKDLKLEMFCEINNFDEISKNIVESNPRLADFIQSPLQKKENSECFISRFNQCRIETHGKIS